MPVPQEQLSSVYREVEGHRPCHKCGYDLQGLSESASCPECGSPIRVHRSTSRFADNLTDAPLSYLKALMLGFTLMSVSILVTALVAAYLSFQMWGAPLAPPAMLHALTLAAAFAWLPGVWIATSKRDVGEHTSHDPLLDSSNLRLAIRLLQISAPAAAVLVTGAAYVPNTIASQVLVGAGAVAGAVSLLSMVPLCVYLSSLADWAGDSGVGERLRGAAWSLAIFGPITVGSMALRPVAGSFTVFARWGAIFVLLGTLLFVFSVLQLAGLSQWAIRNHISGAERDSRLAERRRRERMEREQRIDELAPIEEQRRLEHELPAEDDAPIPVAEGDGAAPSKIRHISETLPPIAPSSKAPGAPAPSSPLTDSGEEHYQEHRIERPQRPKPAQ